MNRGALLPNRLRAPLTHDERVAEDYLDRPVALLKLATATHNRALRGLALELLHRPKKKKKSTGRTEGTRHALA
jgi:hypothetical protein